MSNKGGAGAAARRKADRLHELRRLARKLGQAAILVSGDAEHPDEDQSGVVAEILEAIANGMRPEGLGEDDQG